MKVIMNPNNFLKHAVIVLAAALMLFTVILPVASRVSLADSSDLLTNSSDDSSRSIYVEGYITGMNTASDSSSYPVPGAIIYFIKDQQIVNQTKANAIGYYSVIITPGKYSVVTAAGGFETLMDEQTFDGTVTLDRHLVKVPYAGLIPYAVNSVIETSPGRPASVTICVENSQLQDVYATFSLQTPDSDSRNWVGWCAEGEMLGVRSGDKREISFEFQYNGAQRGAYLWYVLVNAGSFYAKIPVVVVVKNMPYESLDLYSNSPQRIVKAGDTAHFVFSVDNTFAQDKPLALAIDKPDGWGATTGNGSLLYAARGKTASSDLWVYVPKDTAPGYYTVNLTLGGQNVSSNKLMLYLQVQGAPAYQAIIKGYKASAEGYPSINLTDGDTFDIPVRVYNDGDFPMNLDVTAEVGDNWAYYLDGAPWDRITIDPGSASEFTIRSRVPNGTTGNFTAKIYLDGGASQSDSQQTMLMAELNVTTKKVPIIRSDSLGGLLLAGGTAGVIGISLLATMRKRRRY